MADPLPPAGLLAAGMSFGWSVAWAPGPINAEIVRRGLARGFGPAFLVGAGASSGDFCWALGVAAGVGAFAEAPAARQALGVASAVLLLGLGAVFLAGAWRSARAPRTATDRARPGTGIDSCRGGFLLGCGMALTSPFNAAFWLAVLGRPETRGLSFGGSLLLAASVVAGALTWCTVLCLAVRGGARFASPRWEVATRALTGAYLVYAAFAAAARLR